MTEGRGATAAERAPAFLAEPESHLAGIVDSSDDAILSKDRNAVITSWNPGAERLYGYTREEAVGQSISILIPPERANEERRILEQILRGERVEHYETDRVRKDGGRVFVSLTVSPIRDAERRIVGASVIARDITERRLARERAERLQRITLLLAQEIDPDRTLAVLLDEVAPALEASAAAVGLVNEEGDRVELAGSVGYSSALERWQHLSLDDDLPLPHAIRVGEPLWLPSHEELHERFPALVHTTPSFSSVAVIPMSVGRRPFGGVVLSFAEPRSFQVEERAFMVAVTQQAAHALDRARLYDAERRGRERLAFIARASETLSGSLDVEETLETLAYLTVPQIADWCSIDLAEPDGSLRNVVVAHADPERVQMAQGLQRRFPPDPEAPAGALNVIRTGEPELVPSVTDELLAGLVEDDELRGVLRDLGLSSSMVVPLAARNRILGALTLIAAESGQHYSREDLRLAQELADHAALAIDNAALYRREHDAAVALQEALLPRQLPDLPGVVTEGRYLPGGAGLAVGGDWYDLVEMADGAISIVVGDVAGRGIDAAAVMGRLQMALRALILDGRGPASAVERLNTLMRRFDDVTMATLAHIRVDRTRRVVEYVRAGHPPPLLRQPNGSVVELDRGGPPLGVYDSPSYESAVVTAEPSSVLLLYTDGLIERRGEDFRTGLERLKRLLAPPPDSPQDLVSSLIETLGADEREDDVALVAMSLSGDGEQRQD